MKEDALGGRTFSNIVAEYTREYLEDSPLKIIGGQHRFEAIKAALEGGIDVYHGVKVYLGLNTEQRLDVQLVSNTNIAISPDLFDRMQETFQGPHLREWCQRAGLLGKEEDFADRFERGGKIPVRLARTFITNYLNGRNVDPKKFDSTDTTPVLCKAGSIDTDWEELKKANPKLWDDSKLAKAGKEFASLIAAQRDAFQDKKARPKPDFPDKALNPAIVAAWAHVAGMLHENQQRLDRHFSLKIATGKDPLNAAALAKGRHKTDADNYRGLGYRSDAKERGRFVELLFLQAEKGDGINSALIDLAIKKYHAKQAQLEVIRAS
jgi:hypothetical protein